MNKDKDFLEQLPVSFFLNVKADKHSDMSIGRVLRGIKNCAYQKQVINARYFLTIGEGDKYADAKGKLPAVTFCGTFTKGHKAEECEHYNNLLVIDIDKLDEPGMIYTEECLKKDPYIAAYWQSPSGHGYKGLVHLSYDESFKEIPLNITHKTAFQQMFAYLLSTYGIALDRSGSDVSRLCYMSSDENAVIKEEAMAFKVKYDEMTNNAKHNVTIAGKVRAIAPKDWNEIYGKATGYKDNIYNRNLVVYVLKKLTKRHLSGSEKFGSHPKQMNMSKKIKAFLPEMLKVNNDLISMCGFTNSEVFPNFRKYERTIQEITNEKGLRLVFMARVNKMKGYDVIFNSLNFIRNNCPNSSITFYGGIALEDKDDFLSKVEANNDIVSYRGLLAPEKIHETLKRYDVMLLPTKYYTEGFPGSILDAYISGIPVVVTEWKHSHEFVSDGKTGIIVPFENNQEEFNNSILSLYKDRNKLNYMKKAAYKEANKYSEETAWDVLKKYL